MQTRGPLNDTSIITRPSAFRKLHNPVGFTLFNDRGYQDIITQHKLVCNFLIAFMGIHIFHMPGNGLTRFCRLPGYFQDFFTKFLMKTCHFHAYFKVLLIKDSPGGN